MANRNILKIKITVNPQETQFELYNSIIANLVNASESMSEYKKIVLPRDILNALAVLAPSVDGFGKSDPESSALELIYLKQQALKIGARFKKFSKKVSKFLKASHIEIEFDTQNRATSIVQETINSKFLVFTNEP